MTVSSYYCLSPILIFDWIILIFDSRPYYVVIHLGAGLLYGLDAIDVWMTAHNVSCFIRSHQCVQFGYEKCPLPETQSVIPSTSSRMDTHDNIDRCLYTVFSSADYRGAGNEGAVLLVSTNGVMPVTFHGDDIIKPRASNLQTDATDGPDPHCHEVQYWSTVLSVEIRN